MPKTRPKFYFVGVRAVSRVIAHSAAEAKEKYNLAAIRRNTEDFMFAEEMSEWEKYDLFRQCQKIKPEYPQNADGFKKWERNILKANLETL